jgi:hypothetical protein
MADPGWAAAVSGFQTSPVWRFCSCPVYRWCGLEPGRSRVLFDLGMEAGADQYPRYGIRDSGFGYDPCTDTGESGALVRKRLAHPSRLRAAGFAVILTGFLVGGWGLAGVVASGSTETTAQLYQVTITKTIKIRGKNGKVVTHVVRSVRIVKRPVTHNITNVETLTTSGGTRVVTTSTTKVVPVIRVRNKVVTVNGQPVTIAQTVTDMQTQTQSVTQTQTLSQTQTIWNNNTQYVTVTNTQTLPPNTVTATSTVVTTVVVTETSPAVTVTVTVTVPAPTTTT